MIKTILAELARPDDQGKDWYGWASNQMAHALLGVVLALFFPGAPLQMALIVGSLKELADILRNKNVVTLRDSFQDIFFWAIGALLVSSESPVLPVIAITTALICGIVPRLRRAAKSVDSKIIKMMFFL